MITHACDQCGAQVAGEDLRAFGDAYIAHVRESHADWPFPDQAIRNYAEATQRLSDNVERLESIGDIQVHPVTEERMDDWLSFFDRDAFAGNPAWAACYCTEPFMLQRGTPPADGDARSWQDNRRMALDFLRGGRAYGYLAYADGSPVGWVNASRRGEQALYREGDGVEPPDGDVVALSCFLIAPPYRKHGIAARLLERVIADAPARGIRFVEAYPFHEELRGAGGMPDFHGSSAMFSDAGFEPLERRKRYTVVRKTI